MKRLNILFLKYFILSILLFVPEISMAVKMNDGRMVTEKQMLDSANSYYMKASRENHLADSAVCYFDKITHSRNIKNQAAAHLGLTKTYIYLGKNEKATHELYLYEDARNTIEYENVQKNNERVKRNMERGKQMWSNINSLFVVLLIIFLLLVSIGVISYLLIRNKNQKEALLRIRLERMQELHQMYEAKDQHIKDEETHSIEDSECYQKIQQMITSTSGMQFLSDEEWDEIAATIQKVYPNFEHRLYSLCKVSQHQYHVCELLKMGFAPGVIGQLTARSKEAITSTRRRLYEKSFGKKGTPKDWDDVILSL